MSPHINPALAFAGGAKAAAAITADALPGITAVDPSTGDIAGGETVAVWGTGFKSGDQVTVDGNATTETFVDSGKITFTAPADAVGTYDVLVVRGVDNSNAKDYTYTDQTPDPPSDLVFASDWVTATGTSDNALSDGSIWSNPAGPGGVMEVVAASGLDFPSAMTNVLRIEQLEGASFERISVGPSAWSLPSNGSSIWKRVYWRTDADGSSSKGGTNHPLQSCASGGSKCGDLWWHHNYPGGTTWDLIVVTNDTAWPDNRHSPGRVFAYNETYRVEWEFARLTNTTWNLHCRIYNSSNELLYEDADFGSAQGGSLADTPTFTTDDPASQAECLFGFQGGDAIIGGNEFIWFGGYAVSLSDWCGPYASGEGP